jgi:ribosomal protein L29
MEYKELKKKREGELHRILAESRDKLRDLRFKDANKQLKNIREIRKLKKTIAQTLTLLNNKQKIANSEGLLQSEAGNQQTKE